MSDKFESIYGNEPIVVFSYSMTDRAMWQIRKQVWTRAYTEGITDGRAESKMVDRHTIETYVEQAVLDERERIVILIANYFKELENYKKVFGVSENINAWYGAKLNFIQAESELKNLIEREIE